MTREEAIAELSVLHERLSNPKDCEDGCYSWENGWYVEAIDIAIETLQNEETLKTQLANCHKEILRLLDFNDTTESQNDAIESQNDVIEVVRCKDCRWYDNRYGDVCHNPRYGDGHANYQPPYVDEDYWCKDGERKGGEDE